MFFRFVFFLLGKKDNGVSFNLEGGGSGEYADFGHHSTDCIQDPSPAVCPDGVSVMISLYVRRTGNYFYAGTDATLNTRGFEIYLQADKLKCTFCTSNQRYDLTHGFSISANGMLTLSVSQSSAVAKVIAVNVSIILYTVKRISRSTISCTDLTLSARSKKNHLVSLVSLAYIFSCFFSKIVTRKTFIRWLTRFSWSNWNILHTDSTVMKMNMCIMSHVSVICLFVCVCYPHLSFLRKTKIVHAFQVMFIHLQRKGAFSPLRLYITISSFHVNVKKSK